MRTHMNTYITLYISILAATAMIVAQWWELKEYKYYTSLPTPWHIPKVAGAVAYICWVLFFVLKMRDMENLGEAYRTGMAMKAIACGLILLSFSVYLMTLDEKEIPRTDAITLGASLIFTLSTTHNPGKMGPGLGLCGSLLLLSNGLVTIFANRPPQPLAITMAMLLFVCTAMSMTSLNDSPLNLVTLGKK
jgi:hypothetical protein